MISNFHVAHLQKAGGIPASRRFLRRVKSALLRWDVLYRFSLKLKFGAGRHGVSPGPASAYRTLKNRSEWVEAFENSHRLHGPLHQSHETHCDHLPAPPTLL